MRRSTSCMVAVVAGAFAMGGSAPAASARHAPSRTVFAASIRSGPDRGLELVGFLSGRVGRSGRISGRVTGVGASITGRVRGNDVKIVFHLPGGRVLTGAGIGRLRVSRFNQLPRRGLFFGPRRGDIGDWAITTGRIDTSGILLGAPLTGTIVGGTGAGECVVRDFVVDEDQSTIADGTVTVFADAELGSQCKPPYREPGSTFTFGGKTYPLTPGGVISNTEAPGYFVALYSGTAPAPSGSTSCVSVGANSGGVPAMSTTLNPDFTTTTTTTFHVCQH